MHKLEILHQPVKRVKTKSFGAWFLLCRSYRGKTGRGAVLPPILNRVKILGQAFQTLGRVFQTLDWAFEGLRENQKLSRMFRKLGWVIKKLGRVFVLQHGPCCPNQPRYSTGRKRDGARMHLTNRFPLSPPPTHSTTMVKIRFGNFNIYMLLVTKLE